MNEVLPPKGWIATIRYMCTLYNTVEYNVIKTLHKMLDKMQLYLKCQIKRY